jgi:glycosyltransferase involved in cell wall biosynthesis
MPPLITAIMVTKGDIDLINQSYSCFQDQTYPNKRLLIITDCQDEFVIKDKEVDILCVSRGRTLGELRNIGLEKASKLSIQWDDDDWYSPDRMQIQYNALKKAKAVLLTEQLHYFRDTNEVSWVYDSTGIQGTLLLDKTCNVWYPSEPKGEDTVLKNKLVKLKAINLVAGGICYCRTYHGDNTWSRKHHINRIKNFKKRDVNMAELKKAAKIYKWKKDWTLIEII